MLDSTSSDFVLIAVMRYTRNPTGGAAGGIVFQRSKPTPNFFRPTDGGSHSTFGEAATDSTVSAFAPSMRMLRTGLTSGRRSAAPDVGP